MHPLGPGVATLALATLAASGCRELDGVRYELRPSAGGDTLRVGVELFFRRSPPRLTLTGRASVEVADIRDARAFDNRGRPIAMRATRILHQAGGRATWLPALVIEAPVPRRTRIEYWVPPSVRDGSEHMGFHGKAFGFGSRDLVFVVGRNVLLLPDASLESARVEVLAATPMGWSTGVPWSSRSGRFVPGVAGRYADQDLVSAPIAMGRLASAEFAVGPTRYRVVFPADRPPEERRRAIERMRGIATFIDSTLGFHLGPRYTIVATGRAPGGDEIEGVAWGTGQGGTRLPFTPGRARTFARRLTEAHVRDLPYRHALRRRQDFWMIDALEQWLPWRALARIGLANEPEVRAHLAAEYLTGLRSAVDPNLERLYDRSESGKTEREVIAPFLLALWGEGRAGGGIAWPAVFHEGRASAGIAAGRAAADWERFRHWYVQGRARAPAERILDPIELESLPRLGAPVRRSLTLAFTSNTEGYLENCGCKTNQSGGLARRVTVLDSLRREGPVVALDAGSALARPNKRGEPDDLSRQEERVGLRLMKDMSYDAIAVGETELSGGPQHFVRIENETRLPYLGANVRFNGRPLAPAWRRCAAGGLSIGIVGAIDPPMGPDANDSFYDALGDTRFDEPARAVADAVASMGAVDLVVVMGRLSPAAIRAIAAACPRVDVVISSESPTLLGRFGESGDNLAGGTLGRTVVVMSQLSRYGIGVLRLGLDDSLHIARAEMRAVMLDSSVRDDPRVRRELTRFYERTGRSVASQRSVRALFEDDRERQVAPYAGAEACAGCHRPEYDQWLETPHATAYRTLLNVHRHYNPRCVVCHVVGYGTRHGFRLGSFSEGLANVQCEACHGPAAEHARRPTRQNVRRVVTEATCLACHDPEHSEAFVFADRLPRVVHGPPAAIGRVTG